MPVADQHLRAAHTDFTVTVRRGFVRDEFDLGDARPPVGVRGVGRLRLAGVRRRSRPGTSVEPYTRVTTARSKYAAARRISDGDTEAPPQMNTFKSGRRLPARSAADSSCCRNGVAPAMWVQRSRPISATAVVGSH